jgi:hypothetical protein
LVHLVRTAKSPWVISSHLKIESPEWPGVPTMLSVGQPEMTVSSLTQVIVNGSLPASKGLNL